MSDKELKTITEGEAGALVKEVPEVMRTLKKEGKPMHLRDLFPHATPEGIEKIRMSGIYTTHGPSGDTVEVSTFTDKDGYVLSMAAKVLRKPNKSYEYVKNISDFGLTETDSREDKIPLWHKIYINEGVINNAINKTAALVSSEGNFYVRRAKSGNRKTAKVKEELQVLLDFWTRQVNARSLDSAITSAKGLSALIDQATRQALIEGSWVGYLYDHNVDVPTLGKSYTLPMYIQSFSTEFIKIPEALAGTDLEQFLWEPPSALLSNIEGNDDVRLQPIIDKAFPAEILSELKEFGNVLLDPSRVWHLKHRGINTQPFGESFIEPIVSDLAYKRSLQALDFVTIESMVNRILIIKVGSDNEKSDYHNLEFAQQRLQVLKNLYTTVDPNMTILWAGPDIEVLDIGVHNKLADLDGRWKVATDRIFMALGIPQALLTGASSAGQVWAGYEGYRETLRALQNTFKTTLEKMGARIADLNGFEGVEVSFEFDRAVLADQTANADLALRARKDGLASIRRSVSAMGGDFETERRARLMEMGEEPDGANPPTDDEIFSAPLGMPGDTRVGPDGNVKDPGGEPGRPPNTQREDLGPERDKENRNTRDGK